MIEKSELDAHLKTITDAGFEINPPNLARLQGWNEVLLQIIMAKFFLATLQTTPDELGDLENSFTKNAYFLAFLTTYGKCFTGAGGRRISLDEKDAFKGEPDAIAQGHIRIMELRHTFAAHNSESGLVVSTMAAKDEGDVVRVIHLVTQAIPLGELSAFESVILSLEHYVEVRLNNRLDKIEAQIGKRILLE